MYRLILLTIIFLLACEENSSTGTTKNSIKFISSNFTYEPNTVSGFQKRPFAQKKGDTLFITDYWAMSQQLALQAEADIIGDSITLRYLKVPMSVETDWTPTVETVSKLVGVFPNILTIAIEPAPKAREPLGTERSQGFRDARQSLVETIHVDTL